MPNANANANVVSNEQHKNNLATISTKSDADVTNSYEHINNYNNDKCKQINSLTTMSYRELYSAKLTSHLLNDVIERDLNRTFPTHR